MHCVQLVGFPSHLIFWAQMIFFLSVIHSLLRGSVPHPKILPPRQVESLTPSPQLNFQKFQFPSKNIFWGRTLWSRFWKYFGNGFIDWKLTLSDSLDFLVKKDVMALLCRFTPHFCKCFLLFASFNEERFLLQLHSCILHFTLAFYLKQHRVARHVYSKLN